ncbi:MAG: hypothetical protein IKY42_03915 [Bacteroidaceae bacterium]|nr:hypothetical protein [Bacteroidaceae bacterium]
MTKFEELENAILGQIGMLNDNSVMASKEDAEQLIERSKAIASLSDSFIGVNRLKLDVVKELNKNGNPGYEKYLGIEKL